MTQEEKAKRYDEVLKRAKQLLETPVAYDRFTIEKIFHELKESEDERIRKEIIEFLQLPLPQFVGKRNYEKWVAWLEKQGEIDKESYEIDEKEKREFVGDGFIKCYGNFQDFKEGETYWLEYVGNDNYNVRSDNLLGKTYHITPCQLYTIFKKMTWLEKQGEQKPFDYEHANIQQKDFAPKQEPKFHVGDWAVSNLDRNARRISEVHFDEYNSYYVVDGKSVNLEEYDRLHHLWTIQDAKDGDVLAAHECLVLFKEIDGLNIKCYCTYHYMGLNPSFYVDTLQNKTAFQPATKEQRDTLMKAMANAGYTFDFESKELKKIEQKPAWSEEDAKLWLHDDDIILDAAKMIVVDSPRRSYGGVHKNEIVPWFLSLKERLKSIKDRVQPQPKQEWSDEDENKLSKL